MTAQSKTIINRSPALVPCICMAFASACPADPEAEFSRKFSEGFEPAVLLEDHGSDDGAVSLIFSARKTGLAAASWPSIIADVSINGTTVDTENCVAENWIVSLGDKRRLGVIKSAHPAFRPYYPGQNHNELSALWGPEQEGWHYGVLCYTGRWECSDIFFVNHDGETAVATSMRAMLDSASSSAISAKSGDPARYVVSYEPLGFVDAASSVTVADPLAINIRFIAQVPKDDEAETIEGTHRVVLSRDQKGLAKASLAAAGGAIAPPEAPAGVPGDDDFAAMRKESQDAVKAGQWRSVKKDLPAAAAGQRKFVTGWISANVIQQLTRVDSRGEDEMEVVTYFWRDGILVSISKYASGSYTNKEGVDQVSDTYNFHGGRLVGWTNSLRGAEDPNQAGFQELGAVLQKEAVFWSEPIYEAIGAD